MSDGSQSPKGQINNPPKTSETLPETHRSSTKQELSFASLTVSSSPLGLIRLGALIFFP